MNKYPKLICKKCGYWGIDIHEVFFRLQKKLGYNIKCQMCGSINTIREMTEDEYSRKFDEYNKKFFESCS